MNIQKSILSLLLLTTACGQGFETHSVADLSSSIQKSEGGSDESGLPGTGITGPAGICGVLDFANVTWPQGILGAFQVAYALSLEITGSFEGRAGWSNLSNNFDGQGISLGLLQQNLGQGSLQPLLIKMNSNTKDPLSKYFAPADVASLQSMLSAWSRQNPPVLSKIGDETEEDLFPEQEVLSPLDEGGEEFEISNNFDFDSKLEVMSAESDSVQWAVNTVFESDKKTFKKRWKDSFVKMANSASYRSLQIGAAQNIYKKAEGYFKTFKFTEMRMMLLMFDFVTQNGGFNSTHKAQFEAYMKANPGVSETTRANKLLEIRLVSVRDQYKADVKSRKSTIINGTGTVHGSARNLPKEYCYSPRQKL